MKFYMFLKIFLGFFLRIFYRVKVYGVENLSHEGSLIICPNHKSNFDPPFIAISIPRPIHFIGKNQLFKNRFLRFILNKIQVIPLNRGHNDFVAIKRALKVLKDGKVLGIFPEEKRVKEVSLKNFEKGAGLLAIKSNTNILPIYIDSKYKLFRRTNIVIKPVIDISEYKELSDEEALEAIRKRLFKEIYGDRNENYIS